MYLLASHTVPRGTLPTHPRPAASPLSSTCPPPVPPSARKTATSSPTLRLVRRLLVGRLSTGPGTRYLLVPPRDVHHQVPARTCTGTVATDHRPDHRTHTSPPTAATANPSGINAAFWPCTATVPDRVPGYRAPVRDTRCLAITARRRLHLLPSARSPATTPAVLPTASTACATLLLVRLNPRLFIHAKAEPRVLIVPRLPLAWFVYPPAVSFFILQPFISSPHFPRPLVFVLRIVYYSCFASPPVLVIPPPWSFHLTSLSSLNVCDSLDPVLPFTFYHCIHGPDAQPHNLARQTTTTTLSPLHATATRRLATRMPSASASVL